MLVSRRLHFSKGIVTDLTDDGFIIDANPPLAGSSYQVSVQLIKVEDGPLMTEYSEEPDTTSRYQVATFGLGCFWGGELDYMREPGVVGTAVGYTQGPMMLPTYKEVCSGTTGHTEAIAVTYDPSVVSYEKLVRMAMDRLGENKYLLNQVGNDQGTQYRHGVYYHSPEQKKIAEEIVGHYGEDCVTECKPAQKWWPGEEYHQQYLLKGGQSARKGESSVIRCYG
jgi:peptide-methionine (S)-S-oxide reductase